MITTATFTVHSIIARLRSPLVFLSIVIGFVVAIVARLSKDSLQCGQCIRHHFRLVESSDNCLPSFILNQYYSSTDHCLSVWHRLPVLNSAHCHGCLVMTACADADIWHGPSPPRSAWTPPLQLSRSFTQICVSGTFSLCQWWWMKWWWMKIDFDHQRGLWLIIEPK